MAGWHVLSRRRWVVAFILSVGAAALGYAFGSRQFGDAMADYRDLQQDHRALQRTFTERQQQRVNLETADRINRQSLERLRGLVGDLETRLARQAEELELYRSLASDGRAAPGLQIDSFSLRSTPASRVFDYRMVVRRKAALGESVKASVSLRIEGSIHGIPYAVPFREADPSLSGGTREIRLKYFSMIEGSLRVPVYFDPARVVVSLSEAGGGGSPVVRTFAWELTGGW